MINKEGAYQKKFIQNYVDKFLGDGLLASQGEKWLKMRKLANHAFHGESLKVSILYLFFPGTIPEIPPELNQELFSCSL